MNILILNAGSSSQKSCLYSLPDDHLPDQPLEPLWEGSIDLTYGDGLAEIKVSNVYGVKDRQTGPAGDRTQLTQTLLQTLWQGPTKVVEGPGAIHGVGHRVVHGGQVYQEAAQIDEDVMTTIRQLIPLAPVHNPANLAGIEIALQLLGADVPQFAIFDTAFHRSITDAAAVYPGPHAWLEQGIRRYGFHGTSHEYCATRAATLLGKSLSDLRLITCHLGNGCSLAAVKDGQCVDTTMGFTPLEGLMMGTRSGSVDPGILFYLMREKGLGADELDKMLNKESGLKGLSGVSNDMRLLQEAIAQGHPQAKLAFEVYIHRIRTSIGAMLASLGRLDALVFTAGIGEHSEAVRSRVCAGFDFLGLAIDDTLNQQHPKDTDIATADSPVRVLVIHTQEDWQIARTCWQKMHTNCQPT